MIGRPSVLITLAAVAFGGMTLGVVGGEAGSVPAVSGTFTMTSDPGDYIGAGKSYSFAVSSLEFGTSSAGLITVSRRGGNEFWSVRLAAPDGVRLAKGTYTDALRFPDVTQPLLDVSGEGRACNMTTGSFTVLDVTYGAHGYLRSLHFTFEQHCEGALPALRGEVDLTAAPPPPPLELSLTFDSGRTRLNRVDDTLEIRGTITCTQSVQAAVSAEVRQEDAGVGGGSLSLPECSSTPTPWLVTAKSSNGLPFAEGALKIELVGQANDSWYTAYNDNSRLVVASDSVSSTASVALSRGSPTRFVSRHPGWSILVGLLIVVMAVLMTALVMHVVFRRRYGAHGPNPSGPP